MFHIFGANIDLFFGVNIYLIFSVLRPQKEYFGVNVFCVEILPQYLFYLHDFTDI